LRPKWVTTLAGALGCTRGEAISIFNRTNVAHSQQADKNCHQQFRKRTVMKTRPDEAVVRRAEFAERAQRNQHRQTDNCYKKTFEIRVDEIDINGHLHHTKYLEYCSHTRYCHLVETGWSLERTAAHGIGAVTLTEEIRYRLEVRLGDLITVTDQVIGYSADGNRWCTRNRVVRSDGAIAATVTTTGAWFGVRSRRIQAPPPERVAATDAIRSRDFSVLESLPT
jgi:acyl-CoA thioester hydrolase